MARQNRTDDTATDVTDTEVVTDETTDETAGVDASAVTDAPAEDTAGEPDLSGFKAVVESAIGESDKSTGTVPEANLAETLAEYRALDGLKAKNAARAFLEAEVMSSIMSEPQDPIRAKMLVSIKDNLSAGSTSGKSAPKDPTESYVVKTSVLGAAYSLAYGSKPEGVADDAEQKVQEAVEKLTAEARAYKEALAALPEGADEPEASPEIKRIVKLADSARPTARRVHTGERKNVLTHIEQVFADLNEGDFLTVTQISQKGSAEYDGSGPSTGAINQRLFPKDGEPFEGENFKAIVEGPSGSRGAVKK